MDPEIFKVLMGGTGGAGIIVAITAWLRDRRKDRLMDEDTALARLKDDYERKDRSERHAWRLVSWYRNHYYLARDRLSTDNRTDLPAGPPADLEG